MAIRNPSKHKSDRKQTTAYFDHVYMPLIVTSQLSANVPGIGWFAWLEEKEEINIHWALSCYEQGNMLRAFTHVIVFNSNSKPTKGN